MSGSWEPAAGGACLAGAAAQIAAALVPGIFIL